MHTTHMHTRPNEPACTCLEAHSTLTHTLLVYTPTHVQTLCTHHVQYMSRVHTHVHIVPYIYALEIFTHMHTHTIRAHRAQHGIHHTHFYTDQCTLLHTCTCHTHMYMHGARVWSCIHTHTTCAPHCVHTPAPHMYRHCQQGRARTPATQPPRPLLRPHEAPPWMLRLEGTPPLTAGSWE